MPRHYTEEALEKRRAYSRAWYARRKEERSVYNRAWRNANPDYGRVYNLRREYNLSPEDVKVMFEAQAGKCAICSKVIRIGGHGSHVDHDHKTGKVRALLCTVCNTGLGKFGDDPVRLLAAASYLEAHRNDLR